MVKKAAGWFDLLSNEVFVLAARAVQEQDREKRQAIFRRIVAHPELSEFATKSIRKQESAPAPDRGQINQKFKNFRRNVFIFAQINIQNPACLAAPTLKCLLGTLSDKAFDDLEARKERIFPRYVDFAARHMSIGSGHQSLERLKSLPPDELTILYSDLAVFYADTRRALSLEYLKLAEENLKQIPEKDAYKVSAWIGFAYRSVGDYEAAAAMFDKYFAALRKRLPRMKARRARHWAFRIKFVTYRLFKSDVGTRVFQKKVADIALASRKDIKRFFRYTVGSDFIGNFVGNQIRRQNLDHSHWASRIEFWLAGSPFVASKRAQTNWALKILYKSLIRHGWIKGIRSSIDKHFGSETGDEERALLAGALATQNRDKEAFSVILQIKKNTHKSDALYGVFLAQLVKRNDPAAALKTFEHFDRIYAPIRYSETVKVTADGSRHTSTNFGNIVDGQVRAATRRAEMHGLLGNYQKGYDALMGALMLMPLKKGMVNSFEGDNLMYFDPETKLSPISRAILAVIRSNDRKGDIAKILQAFHSAAKRDNRAQTFGQMLAMGLVLERPAFTYGVLAQLAYTGDWDYMYNLYTALENTGIAVPAVKNYPQN